MTMIEKVSRAMNAAGLDGGADRLARIAIEAMREPTDAMCRNGAMCMPDHSPGDDDAKQCWQDMVAAALAE